MASTPANLHAVILAAGLGQRLDPLTRDVPKPMVPVAGKPILLHTLEAISRRGVTSATIVVGHLKDEIKRALGESNAGVRIEYVDADTFDTTNNIYSLWLARAYLDGDVLLLEGDVVFEDALLERLLEAGPGSMAIAPYQRQLSGSVVRLNGDGTVREFVLKSQQSTDFDFTATFKTVNLYYLSKTFLKQQFVPDLCRVVDEGKVDLFYETLLQEEVAAGTASIAAVDVGDCLWWEIDDHNDLQYANYLFAEPAERYNQVNRLYGAHWRYDFADHNHLYNLHFPPTQLIDKLQAQLPEILGHYPPGHAEVARLVANLSNVAPEQVVVANGSSELIRIICGQLTSGLAIPEPSFNEYENSVRPDQYHPFVLDVDTFQLDVAAFAEEVVRSNSNLAVVINPNNPTSLSTPREQLRELMERLAKHDCMVLIDESFIDFSRDGSATSFESEVVDHPRLAVLKSMSKVYGIAGLRLGYMVTANSEFREAVRKRLPIWNINGFSENLLRYLGNYRDEFASSIEQVRRDYVDLYKGLCGIPSLRVFEPDANFVFCRVESDFFNGPLLAQRLFTDFGILIKDCSNKEIPGADRYIRIGSRTARENSRLIEAVRELLESHA